MPGEVGWTTVAGDRYGEVLHGDDLGGHDHSGDDLADGVEPDGREVTPSTRLGRVGLVTGLQAGSRVGDPSGPLVLPDDLSDDVNGDRSGRPIGKAPAWSPYRHRFEDFRES